MNFIIRETTIAEMESPEAVAVQEIHREELATHKHLMKLAPDMETYAKLLEKGILLPLIATYNEKIIGYSINIIEPNSHYKALIGCKNDMIYVLPEYRKAYGLLLRNETKRRVKECGAQIILWRAKEGSPMEKILRKKGLKVQDIIFSEEL